MTEPVLRRGTHDDAAAIATVIRESFPDNPKGRLEVLEWQYFANPFGPTLIWVWDDGGDIVGHYTSIPYPCRFDGQPGTVAVGIDAATAPSHQGRGLFLGIAKALYADGGEHGMPATICYPNANSTRGVTKAGWRQISNLETLVILTGDELAAGRTKLPRRVVALGRKAVFRERGADATGEVVAALPDGIDDLWRAHEDDVPYGVIRDDAWFRWRYEQHPDAGEYLFAIAHDGADLRGLAVGRVKEAFGGRFVYVLELLGDDDAARAAVNALRSTASGLDGLGIVCNPGSPTHARARAAGFRPIPRALAPKDLPFGLVDNTGTRPELVQAPWDTAWGDVDHL